MTACRSWPGTRRRAARTRRRWSTSTETRDISAIVPGKVRPYLDAGHGVLLVSWRGLRRQRRQPYRGWAVSGRPPPPSPFSTGSAWRRRRRSSTANRSAAAWRSRWRANGASAAWSWNRPTHRYHRSPRTITGTFRSLTWSATSSTRCPGSGRSTPRCWSFTASSTALSRSNSGASCLPLPGNPRHGAASRKPVTTSTNSARRTRCSRSCPGVTGRLGEPADAPDIAPEPDPAALP